MGKGNKTLVTTPFESAREDSHFEDGDFEQLARKYDLFKELQADSDELDASANELIAEVDNIMKEEEESIKKNITFKLLFKSIKQSLQEYKTNSTLFFSYTKAYEEVTNEENIVRVLDILREILKERKSTINDVINNLIKIQKLTNDRIKIDKADVDEDVEDLLNPDEI